MHILRGRYIEFANKPTETASVGILNLCEQTMPRKCFLGVFFGSAEGGCLERPPEPGSRQNVDISHGTEAVPCS